MKMEHKAIIERAQSMDLLPSALAHELLVHDLVDASLFELRNIKAPYRSLSEQHQQEVIERITEKATEAVTVAIGVIASRGSITIPCDMKRIQVDAKHLTVTATVDAKDPNRHGLTDSAGHLCLLVIAPEDYAEGLDFIQPDRDQTELPLSAADIASGMVLSGNTDESDAWGKDDPLYDEAVQFVTESRRASISAVQRKLKIGYNRAARLIEVLEYDGVVSAMNSNGTRDVLVSERQADVEQPIKLGTAEELAQRTGGVTRPAAETGKEFGDYTYQDAAQLIVLKADKGRFEAAWVQSRLAIDSDTVTTLLLRLLDDGIIELKAEGATALEHSYTVKAELADVV